jgi:AcrR family transcriptional regulator
VRLRDRKKDATRHAIRVASLDLFEEHGYGPTTVDQISERAEVSPATFFRYFGSKEGVLFSDEDEAVDTMVACVAARTDRSLTLAAMSEPVVAFAALNDDHSPEARRRMRIVMRTKELELRSMRVRRMWERAIAMQLAGESGESMPLLEHELVAVHAVSCYVTALRRWPHRPRSTIARLTREAFDATSDLACLGAHGATGEVIR